MTLLYFSPQIVNALMVVLYVSMPQKQFYKYMTCVKKDRMFYIEINIDKPHDLANRMDYTIWSDKGGNGSIRLLCLTGLFSSRYFVSEKKSPCTRYRR